MSETELVELIRTTTKAGDGTEGNPIHTHEQYFTTDGDLVFERCDGGFCDE